MLFHAHNKYNENCAHRTLFKIKDNYLIFFKHAMQLTKGGKNACNSFR